jgi:small subunit ribosomal protein S6
MTQPPPIYDLVMLLDPELEDPARAKIVADARATIEAQGDLVRHDPWGDRALAYPIARKTTAEYHLLQFHAGTPQLLDTLDHSLRIIDGILRFRIIKLEPGVPEAPDMHAQPSSAAPPRRSDSEQREHQEQPSPQPAADAASTESAAEPAAEPPAEQPAEQPTAEAQVGDPA